MDGGYKSILNGDYDNHDNDDKHDHIKNIIIMLRMIIIII